MACGARRCSEAREPAVAREERSTRRRVVIMPATSDFAEARLTKRSLLSPEGRRNEVDRDGSGELAGPEPSSCWMVAEKTSKLALGRRTT